VVDRLVDRHPRVFQREIGAGEIFVRWCFASSEERLADGIERLAQALG
jgi:hypothetical protein